MSKCRAHLSPAGFVCVSEWVFVRSVCMNICPPPVPLQGCIIGPMGSWQRGSHSVLLLGVLVILSYPSIHPSNYPQHPKRIYSSILPQLWFWDNTNRDTVWLCCLCGRLWGIGEGWVEEGAVCVGGRALHSSRLYEFMLRNSRSVLTDLS